MRRREEEDMIRRRTDREYKTNGQGRMTVTRCSLSRAMQAEKKYRKIVNKRN